MISFRKMKEPLFINGIILFSSKLVASISGFIFWIASTRLFSSEDVGLASSLLAMIGWLSLVALLGFDELIRRFGIETTKSSTNLIISSISMVFLFSLVVGFIFGLLIINLDEYKRDDINLPLLFIIVLITIGFSISFILDAIFISRRKTYIILLRMLGIGISKITLVIIFMNLFYIGIVLATLISLWITNLILIIIYSRKYIFNFSTNFISGFKTLKSLKSYFQSLYVSNLIAGLPGAMLGFIILNFEGPKESAYFATSWVIASIVFGLSMSLSYSFLTESIINPEKKFNTFHKLTGIFFSVFTIIFITSIFLSPFLLEFYGIEYKINSYPILLVLLFSAIPYSYNTLVIAIYQSEKKVKEILTLNIIISIITILGTIIFYQNVVTAGLFWTAVHFIGMGYNAIKLRKIKSEIIK